jgi:uncharacterized protein DUF4232
MQSRLSMSVALCVFSVGLGVAGCSSASSASSSATTSPGGSGSSSSSPATTSPTDAGATAQAEAGTSTPASSQAAASGSTCQPANLSFTLGTKMDGASTQPTQVVDMTNEGSSACTMEGFPGVNLVGVASGQQNYTWPMTRSSASNASTSGQGISKVTLEPGGTAHFDLVYLPGVAGQGNTLIGVDKMVITPPNDYTHAELTWHQSVLLQDAATHPGTYIMPVASGS